jgi:excisionase family DNA binding protein
MNSLITIQMSPEELRSMIREEVSKVQVAIPTEDTNITVKEAAQLLKVSTRTIVSWMDEGKLTRKKIGSTVRISKKEVQSILKPIKQ